MVARKSGLMVEIIEQDGIGITAVLLRPDGDLAQAAVVRDGAGAGAERVAALAITPGSCGRRRSSRASGATEANWREAASTIPKRRSGVHRVRDAVLRRRAVAALAADPQVMRKSGGVYSSGALRRSTAFTDVDGNRPNMARYMKEALSTAGEWQAGDGRRVENRRGLTRRITGLQF
jgi:hypothetical protein